MIRIELASVFPGKIEACTKHTFAEEFVRIHCLSYEYAYKKKTTKTIRVNVLPLGCFAENMSRSQSNTCNYIVYSVGEKVYYSEYY